MLRQPLPLLLLVVLLCRCASEKIYVDAVRGNDIVNDGSFAAPFQSLPRAQTAVQTLLQAQKSAGTPSPIDVILRGGTYTLSSMLDLGEMDSGLSPETPVTYKPYCDPNAPSATSILPFSYVQGASTPLRYLWNGIGDPAAWNGPDDPLIQLGVNPSGATIPPKVPWAGSTPMCVDKVGVGHTCYSEPLASCVQDCMTACERNIDKRVYSDRVYDEFYLLFGRDLKKEEACVETCSVACTTCEKATISGMTAVVNSTSWTLYSPPSWLQPQAPIYKLDLSTLSPAVAPFAELYVNGRRMPRASFPNVAMASTPWTAKYAPVDSTASQGRVVAFNASLFSQNAPQWTRLDGAQVEVLSAALANTRHFIYAMNATAIDLDAGGGQFNRDIFDDGPNWTTVQGFRVENVFEELDAPGEWYYDTATRQLFMIPPTNVDLTTATIEFPQLKQLVRVRGTPGIDLGFTEPGPDTVVTAADEETAAPWPQALWAANIVFDGITFRGTMRTDMELYETLPNHPWTQTRVAAMYIESAASIRVSRCTFVHMGGNAVALSGRTQNVSVVSNHFTHLGSSGVSVLPRSVAPFDPIHRREFFHSQQTNISFNQFHDYGLVTSQSAAVLVVGTSASTVYGNLVYNIPPGGVSYSVSNANADGTAPRVLVRSLETPVVVPETLAPLLGSLYVTSVSLGRFDRFIYPLMAKIIGGPECPPSAGRIGSLYGQQHAGCSDCCLTTQGTASIRNGASGAFTRISTVQPGDVIQLQVESAHYFDAPVDVFVGFHLVTPNRLVELPSWRFHWRVRTRLCVVQEAQQTVSCGGPCGCRVSAGVDNLPPCATGFDALPTSLACSGPFEAWSDCQTGSLARLLYFNCTMLCHQSVCV
ncbi:unnamed protein product [Aphanomyces euteiches]